LMIQGFLQSRLMSAFCKFYGRYNDLIQNYKLALIQMLPDIFPTNSYTILGTLALTDSGYICIHDIGTGCDRSTGLGIGFRYQSTFPVFYGRFMI
jgi:hypothetical protein